MQHLIEFHNRIMVYLLLIFVIICVFLINLFTPLLLQHFTIPSFYVSFFCNEIIVFFKIVIIYFLYKSLLLLIKFLLFF